MTTTTAMLHAFIQAIQHTDPYTTGELPLKFIKKKRIHRLKTPQLQTSEVNNQQTQGCNMSKYGVSELQKLRITDERRAETPSV